MALVEITESQRSLHSFILQKDGGYIKGGFDGTSNVYNEETGIVLDLSAYTPTNEGYALELGGGTWYKLESDDNKTGEAIIATETITSNCVYGYFTSEAGYPETLLYKLIINLTPSEPVETTLLKVVRQQIVPEPTETPTAAPGAASAASAGFVSFSSSSSASSADISQPASNGEPTQVVQSSEEENVWLSIESIPNTPGSVNITYRAALASADSNWVTALGLKPAMVDPNAASDGEMQTRLYTGTATLSQLSGKTFVFLSGSYTAEGAWLDQVAGIALNEAGAYEFKEGDCFEVNPDASGASGQVVTFAVPGEIQFTDGAADVAQGGDIDVRLTANRAKQDVYLSYNGSEKSLTGGNESTEELSYRIPVGEIGDADTLTVKAYYKINGEEYLAASYDYELDNAPPQINVEGDAAQDALGKEYSITLDEGGTLSLEVEGGESKEVPLLKDQTVELKFSMDNGVVAYKLSQTEDVLAEGKALAPGEDLTVSLTAKDAKGNATATEKAVSFTAAYVPVTIDPVDDADAVTDRMLKIAGTAFPGADVAVTVTAESGAAAGEAGAETEDTFFIDVGDKKEEDAEPVNTAAETVSAAADPVAADENGVWTAEVPLDAFEGLACGVRISAAYSGSDGTPVVETAEVYGESVSVDLKAPELTVEADGEPVESDAPVLYAKRDGGLTLTVEADEALTGLNVYGADAEGQPADEAIEGAKAEAEDEAWTLTIPFDALEDTDRVFIVADDENGNASEPIEIPVARQFGKIAIEKGKDAVYSPVNRELTITADPGEKLALFVDGLENGDALQETDADKGEWTLDLGALTLDRQGAWNLYLGGRESDAEGADAAICYTSESANDEGAMRELDVDFKCELEPDVSAIANGANELKGTSDPGATITVTKDGSEIGTAEADEKGAFDCKLKNPLKENDPVTITARDANGNENARPYVAGKGEVEAIRLEETGYDREGGALTLKVGGKGGYEWQYSLDGGATWEEKSYTIPAEEAVEETIDVSEDADGKVHDVVVRYKDFADITVSADVLLSTELPKLNADQQINYTAAELTVKADTDGITDVVWALNEEEPAEAEKDAGGDWKVDLSGKTLNAGDVITLTATDMNGDKGEIKVEVTDVADFILIENMSETYRQDVMSGPLTLKGYAVLDKETEDASGLKLMDGTTEIDGDLTKDPDEGTSKTDKLNSEETKRAAKAVQDAIDRAGSDIQGRKTAHPIEITIDPDSPRRYSEGEKARFTVEYNGEPLKIYNYDPNDSEGSLHAEENVRSLQVDFRKSPNYLIPWALVALVTLGGLVAIIVAEVKLTRKSRRLRNARIDPDTGRSELTVRQDEPM